MNTGLLLYPIEPDSKKWIMWALLCQQVLGYYLKDVKVTIRPTTDNCPAWKFTTNGRYESALLGTFCCIMKYIHLLRYTIK